MKMNFFKREINLNEIERLREVESLDISSFKDNSVNATIQVNHKVVFVEGFFAFNKWRRWLLRIAKYFKAISYKDFFHIC